MSFKNGFTLLASFILLAQMSTMAVRLDASDSPDQNRAGIQHPVTKHNSSPVDQASDPRQQPIFRHQLQLQPGYQNPADAWLVTSPEFDSLSGAAQTYLLRKYGLLNPPPPESSSMLSTAERATAAAAQQRPPSGNIKVNDPAQDAGDRTQSESCSAAFGSTIVIGYNDAGTRGSGSALSFSHDGGNTWTETHIPTYSGGINFGDPAIAAGPNGEFYYSTLASDQDGISSIGVTRSDNGAATWLPVVNVSTAVNSRQSFQDKEWLAVDTTNSPYRGNVYVSWTFVQAAARTILFTLSTDKGQTWSPPLTLSSPTARSQGSFIAIGPNGEIYVAWFDVDIQAIRVVKSTDGGVTFGRPSFAARITNPVLESLNGGFASVKHFPSMAVDVSDSPYRGHVYIVFNARGHGHDASDVFLIKSTNGGRTWSAPVRINDDATDTDQWMPSVTVARNGTVAVMWYDRRNDPTNNSLIDVYMATSINDGNSFSPNQRITTSNWMLVPAPRDVRFGYHGDYNQISASDTQFICNWGDDREGDANVFVSLAPVTGRPVLPDFSISSRTLLRNIVAGEAASFTIGSSALAGFSGSVSLSASPIYAGFSFSFSSESITPGSDVVLTVNTLATVEPGTYLITVTASDGRIERATNLRLAVYSGVGLQQPPSMVSNTREGAGAPSVAVDGAGIIHVVWRALDRSANPAQGMVSKTVVYSQLRSGRSGFSPPIRLSDPGVSAINPQIKVDTAGNINVLWTQTNPDSGFADIYLSRSTNGGQSFSSPVNVSRGNNANLMASQPYLAVDPAGNIYASWTRLDLTTQIQDVFSCRSADGGQTFSTAVNVSQTGDPTSPASQPAIAVDVNGTVCFLWVQGHSNPFSQEIFFSRSSDGGQTFSAPVNISQASNSGGATLSPILAIARTGNIHAAWTTRDVNSGKEEVYFSTSADGGETFSPPGVVSQANLTGGIVCGICDRIFLGRGGLGLDAEGTISLVWTDTSANNYEVFYSQSTDGGRSFSTPVNVSGNIGLSLRSSVAVGDDGRIAIVWDDDSDGIGNILLIASPSL
jgi:hypothetical protein